MNVAAVIPARGGSRGIPRKNLVDFCGKPLVAWSIIQARDTPLINSVHVSSDSDEILAVSARYGAQTIKRPNEISGDTATTESALLHAWQTMPTKPDLLVLLQPTSPLRKPDDLQKALAQFQEQGWDSAFSGAVLLDFLIWEKDSRGTLRSFNYDYKNRGRRQDRQPQYVENGSFYLCKPDILQSGNRLGGRIGICLMDFWQSFEIDTSQDLEMSRLIFESKLRRVYA